MIQNEPVAIISDIPYQQHFNGNGDMNQNDANRNNSNINEDIKYNAYNNNNQNNENTIANNVDSNHNNNDTSEGTWLLITSTMGLTLGYVRIDDHDHDLLLSEIRDMIVDKLRDNLEYCNGWNFGISYPPQIVAQNDESSLFAKNVLPSVSVVSVQSAQHIINTSNPMSAATALTYGIQPINMQYSMQNMQYLQSEDININTANAMQSITPTQNQQENNITEQKQITSDAQLYYANNGTQPNIVSLLQPVLKQENGIHALNSGSRGPPDIVFSPEVLSQQQIEEQSKLQKQKLLNLLPNDTTPKNMNPTGVGGGKRKKKEQIKSIKSIPHLKPIGVDGKIIENTDDNNNNNNNNNTQTADLPPEIPDLNIQRQKLKELYCAECDKYFTKSREHKQHMFKEHQIKVTRQRNKERRFSCSTCSKSFYQRSDLRRHLRVHLKVKPFQCSICKKEFTQRGSLYRHIKSSHKSIKNPKSCIILRTDKTLPVTQVKQAKQAKNVSNNNNDNNLPPAINNNNIPPALLNNLPPIIDCPPPLTPLNSAPNNPTESENTINNPKSDVVMESKTQPETE